LNVGRGAAGAVRKRRPAASGKFVGIIRKKIMQHCHHRAGIDRDAASAWQL
jgi:hypothetical protein